ncbi:VCBS repeat-containing protein [Flavobacteriaceae bacterium TP-CH-4]|uniref:VCBS repeat-containing protein n=1 Tax=Pelagihabitans pacificus TaxID=2696054 RepID=A0A967E7T7_9FLAO|nr:VCBS repeat-containing protein [Pelagihabitans pacificus]NHF60589.1 VCBS repeat-containing protein [Pelagihabitans pacificus]
MRRRPFHFLIPLALTLVGCKHIADTSFKEMSPSTTGVDFSNTLVLGGNPSVLEFEYMYNGAGVAVADFDQDGLQDLYFTGNMVSNRMYRNLGDWKFEDVTKSARVGSENWSNGVSIVDINQDGYPDIYVCKGGHRGSTGAERANLLFINNGNKGGRLGFTEAAKEWGLADESYSVQAAFFDYDGDGDLDMYLLSNALVDFNRNTPRPKDRTGKAPSADKLFRNNGDNTFTDVSKEAGILIEGFGLGVEICDMNTDGWPDVYVSNDFLTDDLLYINQKDGTFSNEASSYFRHLTFNGMGNDIADINNDGHPDVVVLDMLPPDNKRWKLTMMGNNYDEFQNSISDGYQPQYIRNTLQLNNGNGSFSEIGQIAGISATEWSWSPLLADYDNDGLNDLFVTNGYRQDITNLDFMVYGNNVLTMGTEEANREQRLNELNKLPGIKIHNFMFKNKGDLSFEDITEESGFSKPTYSNGAVYADLDNDGDLDLIINNIDDPAGLYQNTAEGGNDNYIRFRFEGKMPNRQGIGSQVEIFYQGKRQKKYYTPYRGYLSTVEQALHFGLGATARIDSLKVIWPDGKKQKIGPLRVNQELVLRYQDARTAPNIAEPTRMTTLFHALDSIGLDIAHVENEFVDYKIQPLLPHMHSRNGPGIAVADVNNDGLEDMYVGGARGQSGSILLQRPNGSFEQNAMAETETEDMGTLFFDADNDGDQDLYVVSGGSSLPNNDSLYRDRFYQNSGSGIFVLSDALPKSFVSGSVVAASDYDKDGDLDLFVGGRIRPGAYPLPSASCLLKNHSADGTIKFEADPQPVDLEFDELGMVTDAIWTDFNNDTWQDLIVIGEFMKIHLFENKQGILNEITDQTGLEHTTGWWNSISSGDFDNDGDTDYILGNLGLNSRYKASAKEPLCVYASDYDKNGQIDPVMCYYIDGENYLAHSRNDLIDQINAMRIRFRTYSDYAEATFEESFLKEELADAYVVKSETFANSYLENLGSGKFKLSELPMKAQIAPIYGMLIKDYTNDGNLDILAVGNFYSGEVFSGRYDASIGWLLKGDGKGGFSSVDVSESGFFVTGDAKGMVALQTDKGPLTVVGINDGTLKVFLGPKTNRTYTPEQNEVGALIEFKDGKRHKVEFHYGGGYLSHSSRTLQIPADATSVKIIDSNGDQTEILPIL